MGTGKLFFYLGAIVIDARRGSNTAGTNRFPLYISQSRVFCWRIPHVLRIRSDISLISVDDLWQSNKMAFHLEWRALMISIDENLPNNGRWFRCWRRLVIPRTYRYWNSCIFSGRIPRTYSADFYIFAYRFWSFSVIFFFWSNGSRKGYIVKYKLNLWKITFTIV